jgi:hypothetical protein
MVGFSLAQSSSPLGIPAPPVAASASPLVPDPSRTPGDVLITEASIVCVPGYTKTVRNVPQVVKEAVYKNCSILSRQPSEYEVDHLISPELGGSNTVKNLWPQSYITMPLNAHVKDRLEGKLHTLACSEQITLQEAHQAITENWTSAFVIYLRVLLDQDPRGVKKEGVLCTTESTPFTILTQKPSWWLPTSGSTMS